MVIDRLQAFLGYPYKTDTGIKLYSPTIAEIAAMGYLDYMIHLQLSLFDKSKILLELFRINFEKYESLKDENDYDVLIQNQAIRDYIAKSLSVFVKDTVEFDENRLAFYVGEVEFINKNNYTKISSAIQELNAIVDAANPNPKFKNGKAKEILDKLNHYRNQHKQKDSLDLKDILSILCAADGNGINVFNVHQLTIYQAYEHFERTIVKDKYQRLLPVWANGYLQENAQLPEWISKTKF